MKISYKYTLDDFKVISTNILKNYNIQDTRTLGNGDYIQGYEIYRIEFSFWGKEILGNVQVRFETLEEVESYLLHETGEHLKFKSVNGGTPEG